MREIHLDIDNIFVQCNLSKCATSLPHYIYILWKEQIIAQLPGLGGLLYVKD